MLICFVDESSTPPKRGARRARPYFTIAGLFIPVAQWHEIARELQRLKNLPQFRIRGEIKWRYFGLGNDDPRNNVRHLDLAARDDFRRQMFAMLARRNSIKAVACIAKVEEAYNQPYISDEHDLYSFTYKPVSERFQYHLQDVGRLSGTTQLGLVVADHRGRNDDERLRRHHQRLVYAESPFISTYANFLECLFLTPSHTSVGLQFADMIAGAVGRKYNADDDTWFEVVRPIIRSRPDGSIEGYGIVKMPNTW